MASTAERLKHSALTAYPKGLKTAWWLIKITVPVSFGVMLLQYFGLLDLIAGYTAPFFQLLGLPGVAAIVFITSIFTNIYSVVAILAMLQLPMREGIILACMCLISHGFIIETAVLKKTGSSVTKMLLLRLTASFMVAFLLNQIMPGNSATGQAVYEIETLKFTDAFANWFFSIGQTVIKILILVNVLLFFQQVMEEFNWIRLIEKPMKPALRLMGLPPSATLSWLVANLIGLAYGSAIMIDQRDKGRLTVGEADLLNHHVAISHSQLEDPLLFLTLGFTLHWLMWPRFLMAVAAVWIRRLCK
ncbi:MAG: nucleoside recognition protein [Lentimicrobiaceae bacterium]|nr:nucleoside recognition protein [Lentimicrobiaceae bacterium]MDD4598892.1 nucleoside recognition protein [Lentimicrobiaceae bacterium]MDY0026417.1 nucleoside recognition protein [Lentimicrobium sp.]